MKFHKTRGKPEWASAEGYRIVDIGIGICPFVCFAPDHDPAAYKVPGAAAWGLGAHSSLDGAKRTARQHAADSAPGWRTRAAAAPMTCGLCARIGTNDTGGPRVHAPGCPKGDQS